jgi:putative ABC transport system permease protein
VVGVYRAFPPTDPLSELVVNAAAFQGEPPDFYLARAGGDPDRTAAALRHDPRLSGYTVQTLNDRVRQEQRGLTALGLAGLSRIEVSAAALIAAVGVGVLGAFLVLERRRELALLRLAGAGTATVTLGPLIEAAVAALGSLAIGLPVGIGLAMLAVRVLGLFFALPPPLVTIPVADLAVLAALVCAGSALAMALVLRRLVSAEITPLLRAP